MPEPKLYRDIVMHRHARAAVPLSDNGMGHEAGIIARIMMEHTVVTHWIVERGDDGVDALLANQSKRMKPNHGCRGAAKRGCSWAMTSAMGQHSS